MLEPLSLFLFIEPTIKCYYVITEQAWALLVFLQMGFDGNDPLPRKNQNLMFLPS
jgi:hypothetical protein